MKRHLFALIIASLYAIGTHAQALDKNVEEYLMQFFSNYQTTYANIGNCKLDSFSIDHKRKSLIVYASQSFGYQPFNNENVPHIYRLLKQSLPGPVSSYDITVYADGKPIEELVPNYLRKKKGYQPFVEKGIYR